MSETELERVTRERDEYWERVLELGRQVAGDSQELRDELAAAKTRIEELTDALAKETRELRHTEAVRDEKRNELVRRTNQRDLARQWLQREKERNMTLAAEIRALRGATKR